MYIQVLKNNINKWYFRVKAGNNKTLCHSEYYNSLKSCIKTALLFKLTIDVIGR